MNARNLSMRTSFLFLLTILFLWEPAFCQVKSLSFDGNFRLSYNTSGEKIDLSSNLTALRSRIGARYSFNSNHSFRARIAGTVSDELESLRFTIQADGAGLNLGSFSFDEFYYRYKSEDLDIKVGRFQHSIGIQSNAGRSIMRFQSNNISIHWTDGIYAKRDLNKGWYAEFIGEYQPRNHTTYPYRAELDFGNNADNFTSYLGFENRNRDEQNIIQKGVGVFFAPNSFNKNGEYTNYTALTSRIAFDFPQEKLLGGSIRVAGELGQNLNTSFEDGTIAIASIGVNNVAEKHEFMVEFTKSDRYWLLANVYGVNTDEIELRYRFFATDKLNFGARFRIRDFRTDNVANNRNLFIRATYSFK